MKSTPITTLFIDLDDTVYPSNSGLWNTIRDRITLYMFERLNLSWEVIPGLRQRLFSTYGTTMRGLLIEFNIDEEDFLAFVHNVPLKEYITPDPELRKSLMQIPQRKIIFTNADDKHAERVLKVLEIRDCFEKIIDIHTISPHCKPQEEAYKIALKKSGAEAENCSMIDDSVNNLTAAYNLGFYTIRVGGTEISPTVNASISHLKDLPLALKPK